MINHRTKLVSKTGGILEMWMDGELMQVVDVPPGITRAAEYTKLLPEGAHLEAGEGVVPFQPGHRVAVIPYGEGATASGANPDFRPTSASRLEREMRLTMNRMKAATDRIEARERSLARIERIPRAPVETLIEDDPPAPAPAPVEPKAKEPVEAPSE